MTCPFCHWDWRARVENPKACPRCKRRLDRPDNIKEPAQAEPVSREANDD